MSNNISYSEAKQTLEEIMEAAEQKLTPAEPEYDTVTKPEHYNHGKFETIEVVEDWRLNYHCGNALKYISRHNHKGKPAEDIKKAIWYLQRYLQVLEEN